jgi:ribosomal protein S18 acetylase RimI-like enzyme
MTPRKKKPEGKPWVLNPDDPSSLKHLVRSMKAGGGECTLIGLGGSMIPTLQPGETISLQEPTGQVIAGDIVVFPWRGRILTHRVIRVQGDSFFARGDSCVLTEGPVPISSIVGQVTGFSRKSKTAGLAYNVAMSHVRKTARRWPNLRKKIEIDLLGSPPVRTALAFWGRSLLGNVALHEEQNLGRIVGALISDKLPLTEKLLRDVEIELKKNLLWLLSARSEKKGLVGQLLLKKLSKTPHSSPKVGFVFSLQVRFLAEGMGVGKMLLEAAEQKARAHGMTRLTAQVDKENLRSLRLFQSMGFRIVEDGERWRVEKTLVEERNK